MKNSTASVLIILNIITLSLLIFLMIEKADNNHSHDTTHVHDTTHSHDYAESYHSHNAKEIKFGIFQGDVESRIEELENKIKNLESKIKKLQNDILFMVLELSR